MTLQLVDGKFRDSRWQEGRWVLDSFKDNSGSMDWDKVRVKINGYQNTTIQFTCSLYNDSRCANSVAAVCGTFEVSWNGCLTVTMQIIMLCWLTFSLLL